PAMYSSLHCYCSIHCVALCTEQALGLLAPAVVPPAGSSGLVACAPGYARRCWVPAAGTPSLGSVATSECRDLVGCRGESESRNSVPQTTVRRRDHRHL